MLPTIIFFALGVAEPQLDSAVTTRPAPASAVPAARVRGALSIDGRLNDPAWSGATMVASLTQRVPQEGAPPTQRTEIRLLYDDNALYIGVRLYDTAPDSVKALLARRDRMVSADR
ncbi:MAG TPA: sugar-binding protein, partial [Gemmatimonadales bacterium]|nr:sugar-binding protein [Gemmatimonadales bacterium]